MGNCSICRGLPLRKEDKRLSETVKKIKPSHGVKRRTQKALFLGTGGSGKSTIFKQIRKIYGQGWSKEAKLTFIDHIHAQIIEQMNLALECIEFLAEEELENQFGEDYKTPDDWNPFAQLSDDAQKAVVVIQSVKNRELNDETAAAYKTLWNEQAIKDIYDQRATMKVEDSSAYFWDKIDEINTSEYVPDEIDILLVRYRTTGYIEQKFAFKNVVYHMLDVGGQKSERKKWIRCFESVSALIFIVSLSGYDEVMFEDECTNTMDDAIQLFKKIVNNEWFEKSKIFLVFNKTDLFREKLRENKPLTLCPSFKEYDGDMCYDECFEYIKNRFLETLETEKNDDVYVLEMCATDQNNVKTQFLNITRIINGEIIELNVKTNEREEEKKEGKVSKGEKALRTIGKLVYFLVMLVYGLHIMLLYPFLHFCCRKKLKNSSWLFEKIPIQDSFHGSSILLTTIIVLTTVSLLDLYTEIQSWMVAYMTWCIYVVIYLFNRAATVYSIFSDREICGMKAGNVKGLNLIIKYVVGVEVDNKAENNYTRLLAVVGGLFPALLAGLIANYILQERYTLKCSKDFVSEMSGFCEGSICCKVISSHDIKHFYQFIGVLASRIIASFGIVRIIGWLFCKGHPELRDIAQKMQKKS